MHPLKELMATEGFGIFLQGCQLEPGEEERLSPQFVCCKAIL